MKLKQIIAILFISIMLFLSIKTKAQAIDTACAFSTKKVYMVNPTLGSTYYWSVDCGEIVSSNVNTDSIEIIWCKIPGIYELRVVEKNKFGCWGDTIRTKIMVNGKIHLIVSGPKDVCAGYPVVLQASGAQRYLWSTGEKTPEIIVKPVLDSTYYRVIGYGTCETDSAEIIVRVHQKPKADFTYKPQKPDVNEMVLFQYTGKNANSWKWFFGSKDSIGGSITNPGYTFNEKGKKRVTLVASNATGCTDTITYTLNVGYESKIFVPNAFTPNGDSDNDSFKAIGFNLKSIHMTIFNRWGEQIFESFKLNDAWDGSFKGARVMEGVYLYLIDAEATDGEHYYLSGNVTLLY